MRVDLGSRRGTSTGIAASVVALVLCSACADRELDLGRDAGFGGVGSEDSSELVREIEGGVALAVDEERIYWIERAVAGEARVASCAKDSCSLPTYYGTARYYQLPFLLAAAAGQVYWQGPLDSSDPAESGLFRCEATGCSGPPELLETSVLDLAVDAEAVYYVYDHVRLDSRGVTIRRLAHGASVETAIDVANPPQFVVHGLMVHGGDMYWIPSSSAPRSGIESAPVGGGLSRTLASAQLNPISPASDGTYLYWASHALVGKISRCTLPICADEFVVQAQVAAPNPVLVDGTDLYWGFDAGDTNVLARLAASSSRPETILVRLRQAPPDPEDFPGVGLFDAPVTMLQNVASDGAAVYALAAPSGEVSPATEIRRVWK